MSVCDDKIGLLNAFVDNELDAANTVAMEQHLKTCPACVAAFAEIRAVREAMHAPGVAYEAPEPFRRRLNIALQAEAAPPRRQAHRKPGFGWAGWGLLGGGGTLASAGVALTLFMGVQTPAKAFEDELVSDHVRSMLADHLLDVPTSDRHTVKPWFDGKLDFAPPVVDLKEQGFPLVGGRLDYVDHRNVAALVYQRRKHFINVFVWPEESKAAKLPDVQTIQGYNLVSWSHDGMRFCAASDLNIAEIRQFAGLLEQ